MLLRGVFIGIVIGLYSTSIIKCEPSERWILDRVTGGESNYDRFIHPHQGDGPTVVRVEFYVESIGNYKAATMDYDLDIYFIEHWEDKRLNHTRPMPISINDREIIKKLWTPDLYFANSKTATYNDVTVPNCNIKISRNGSIRYSNRIHLKVSCHMDLRRYPLDYQQCHLKIVSYGQSKDVLEVVWHEDGLTVNPEITEADLKLYRSRTSYCVGAYYGSNYSCLIVHFDLKREIGSSIFHTYGPTLFIVMISWISFWIDPSSVPGRVALSITTLLTLSTQAAGIRMTLPAVRYAKALDIWLGICMIFLFAVLIEFAWVNMYIRRLNKVKQQRSLLDLGIKTDEISTKTVKGERLINKEDYDSSPDQTAVEFEDLAREYKRKAEMIDYGSRLVFPGCFALFCLVYWTFYLL